MITFWQEIRSGIAQKHRKFNIGHDFARDRMQAHRHISNNHSCFTCAAKVRPITVYRRKRITVSSSETRPHIRSRREGVSPSGTTRIGMRNMKYGLTPVLGGGWTPLRLCPILRKGSAPNRLSLIPERLVRSPKKLLNIRTFLPSQSLIIKTSI